MKAMILGAGHGTPVRPLTSASTPTARAQARDWLFSDARSPQGSLNAMQHMLGEHRRSAADLMQTADRQTVR